MADSLQKEKILGSVVTALNRLENCPDFALLMPEVRVNLVYALPDAKGPGDVAAIGGRITVVHGLPRASGLPSFGASDHMARLIIETRKYDQGVNAGINFRCDSSIIAVVEQYCSAGNITCGRIDRKQEPDEIREKDGSSMPWKISQLYGSYGCIPRIFYEDEGWGKEPLHVILGKEATEVADIAIEIAELFARLKRS